MLNYTTKKPLGDYTLNEMIAMCKTKKGYCEDCPLSSLCRSINVPYINHFYEKDLEELIYFNTETGESRKEDTDETN